MRILHPEPEQLVLDAQSAPGPEPGLLPWPQPGMRQHGHEPLRPVPLIGPEPGDLQVQETLRPGQVQGPLPGLRQRGQQTPGAEEVQGRSRGGL